MDGLLIQNPFLVGKYVTDRYFCDRENETAFLIKQIQNGRNVAIISPRRLGKTGLIHHCFNREVLRNDYYTFFVDIYATTSFEEFVYLFGKAIYEELEPKKTPWSERFFQVISSLRVGFKLDSVTGEPSFDLGLGNIQTPQLTLDEIFTYLESADKPCVVAIDEFQQIGNYGDKNIEALLRTKIQQCKRTQFVFLGSKRHTMSLMFNSPNKPFYQSALSMGLAPIPMEAYCDFAIQLFEERGKRVDREVVERVYKMFDGCTWYVQMMMNELFALTPFDAQCSVEQIEMARRNVIIAQEGSYKDILSQIPSKQKMVLSAIAKECKAQGVTSSSFIKKYNLSSASSVQSAIKGLLKNDLITQDNDTYRIYDYFFSDWLATEY